MLIKKIYTKLNSFQIYTIFKNEKYSFFLDSAMDKERLGRYSFIGFNPFLVFKSKNDSVEIIQGEKIEKYIANPFDKLKEIFSKYKIDYKSELPFVGGAVGYFSYDLCNQIEKLPRKAVDDENVPDCHLGFYDGIVIVDHLLDDIYVSSIGIKDKAEEIVDKIEQRIKEAEIRGINIDITKKSENGKIKSNFTKEEYIEAIEKIRNYIKCGDIYQANMTQRFECDINEEPYDIYSRLRDINPAPFASFIDFGDGYIVSSSPERFVKIKDKYIETRPIKGTCPRGKNEQEDERNKNELLNSEKDKAELLMIVDLERNDLSRISKTGSVKVTELFHLETYPTVHHLVSTVIGEVKDDVDVIDCIKAIFPGGSITGAPKIRSMEIIDELEPTQRGIYTGSIGYIGFNGDLDLNIVIRTMVCKGNKAYFQAGGGITWHSNAQLEYEESLHKAKALIKVLES